jgi:GxxExxY protein
MTDECFNELVTKVTAVAEDVLRVLGPDHLDESAYDRAMRIGLQGVVEFVSQPVLPVLYKRLSVAELRPDFYLLIRDETAQTVERVALELKSLLAVTDPARQQVKTYLKHGYMERGILINFSFAEQGSVQVETFGGW